MIILIPLALSDEAHVASFVKNLKAMPPAPSDKGLIVPTPSAMKSPVIAQAIEDLRHIFGIENIIIEPTPNTPDGGWPKAANTHFMWGVSAVQKLERTMGPQNFMWLESDTRFLVQRWSESLQTEYRNGGRPFLGVESPSIVTVEHKDKTLEKQIRGVHMMGVGIYPANYTYRRVGWKFPQKNISFTIYCQKEHSDFQRTKLIAHCARTINWKRLPDGKFSCEDVPNKHPHAIKYGGTYDFAGFAIVHGCKDDSLTEAILAAPLPAPQITVIPKEELHAYLLQENQNLKDEIKMLKDQLESYSSPIHAISTTVSTGNHSVAVDTQTVDLASSPPSLGILPSVQAVEHALSKGSMTLKEMAAHFVCDDVSAFEQHLNSIGYEAPKPVRRVRAITQAQPKGKPAVKRKKAA